ncbi:MAG: hypothetical protein NW206_19980 [Hyphomonadaceae bacterium]|nr:hypothetical protein [Hyphomonadaceae bacterium]
MICKLFEIRDRATCITALAIRPGFEGCAKGDDARAQRRYHLSRCGYDWRNPRSVLLGDMNGRKPFNVDPYDWGDRTWTLAHLHIEQHFDELEDGAVIDVRVLAGEASEPAAPDRLSRFGDTP